MNLKTLFRTSILIFCLVFGFAATPASADSVSYKWMDDNGNIVYSQNPPRDRKYEVIRSTSSAGKSSTSKSGNSSAAVKALEASAATRKEKEKETLKEADIKKKRAAACENAKKNVETYTIYRRVQKPDGSVVRLDDKDRAHLLKQAQDDVAEYCK